VSFRHWEVDKNNRHVSAIQLAICAVVACATSSDGKPKITVTLAPDFAKTDTVSVFGIFRDGRISPQSWEEFGGVLSSPFGQKPCEAAYTDAFVDAQPELSAAVDDYAKENGLGDELLDRFAAQARGEVIMAITMIGQAARPPADAGAAKPVHAPSSPGQSNYGAPASGPGGGRGMGRGGGGGFGRGGFGGRRPQSTSEQHPKSEPSAWEVSVSLFSVRLHHSIGEAGMSYSGSDPDGALKAFAARLGAEMPGAACRGWDWSAPVDGDSVRRMMQP
jgi:hypothetical protein